MKQKKSGSCDLLHEPLFKAHVPITVTAASFLESMVPDVNLIETQSPSVLY